RLFYFTRANKGLTTLAETVGPFFAISPDGSRILFEQVIAGANDTPSTHALAVMNRNGSSPQQLFSLDALEAFPMLPNWRSADEITFISAPAGDDPLLANREDRLLLNVIHYHLTADNT